MSNETMGGMINALQSIDGKRATFVRDVTVDGPRIKCQRLYRVDPPMTGFEFSPLNTPATFVVVSAVMVAQVDGLGPETYIFPAEESGEITDWLELPGSQKGTLDHAVALQAAGYAIQPAQTGEPPCTQTRNGG